jgi:hypothetical protein
VLVAPPHLKRHRLKSRAEKNLDEELHYFGLELAGVGVGFFVTLDKVVFVTPFVAVLVMVFSGDVGVSVSGKEES